MRLTSAVIVRLNAEVQPLSRRVQGALDLSELLRQNALPSYTPAAFVIDNGMTGRSADLGGAGYLQAAEETVSVLLVIRTAGDVTGAKGQPALDALKWAVIFALAGFEPEPDGDEADDGTTPTGVLELRRGRVNQVQSGTIFYQLDFAISQQIRVLE